MKEWASGERVRRAWAATPASRPWVAAARSAPALLLGLLLVLSAAGQAGCASRGKPEPADAAVPAVELRGAEAMAAARGQWVWLYVRAADAVTVSGLSLVSRGEERSVQAWQLCDVLPVKGRVPGVVRQRQAMAADDGMGLDAALAPLSRGDQGTALPAGQWLWLEFQVPAGMPGGDATLRLAGESWQVDAPIRIHDFTLTPQLTVQAELEWALLARLFPETLQGTDPRLLARGDERQAAALQLLDDVAALLQAHSVQPVVGGLAPVARWPAGGAVQVDARSLLELLRPWTSAGDAWPMPAIAALPGYRREARQEYWRALADAYAAAGLLPRAAVRVGEHAEIAGAREALEHSLALNELLDADARLRLLSPLLDDEVAWSRQVGDGLPLRESAGRMLLRAPGLIARRVAPVEAPQPPQRWLAVNPGGTAWAQAGMVDEADTLLWGHLAFLRDVRLMRVWGALPIGGLESMSQELRPVLCYPGRWWGRTGVLPSMRLKLLRQALEDHAYLQQLRRAGERSTALVVSRLLCKPVELGAGQAPVGTDTLLAGTADAARWREARALLAALVEQTQPHRAPNDPARAAAEGRLMRWIALQERPTLLVRSVRYLPVGEQRAALTLAVGVDVYNASDARPDRNALALGGPVPALTPARALDVDPLAPYRVVRHEVSAEIDPQAWARTSRRVTAQFTSGFDRRQTLAEVVAPVLVAQRRQQALQVDGSLDDWVEDDLIGGAGMPMLLDHRSVQLGHIQTAGQDERVYATWDDQTLHVAWRSTSPQGAAVRRSFVQRWQGRVIGEDAVEVILQLQPSAVAGPRPPLIHLVCKPTGVVEVARRLDARFHAEADKPLHQSGVKYAATVYQGAWRGEVAIPRQLLEAEGVDVSMLRMNLTRYQANGQGWSCAGRWITVAMS